MIINNKYKSVDALTADLGMVTKGSIGQIQNLTKELTEVLDLQMARDSALWSLQEMQKLETYARTFEEFASEMRSLVGKLIGAEMMRETAKREAAAKK